MNYDTTSLIFNYCINIWFLCLDLSVTLDHNSPQNLYFFIFNNTFWSIFIPFFILLFRLYFLHNLQLTILATLFCLLLYAFCANFPYNFQCQILFYLSCHTFYEVVIRLFYLSCVSYSLFELPVLVHHTIWLPFQLSSQLFSASRMFLFHLLFLEFLLQAVHIFFCCFFPLMQLCLNSFLFTVTVSLYYIYCFCSFHTLNQWLN